jgi:hypothetical protein
VTQDLYYSITWSDQQLNTFMKLLVGSGNTIFIISTFGDVNHFESKIFREGYRLGIAGYEGYQWFMTDFTANPQEFTIDGVINEEVVKGLEGCIVFIPSPAEVCDEE